MTEPTKDPAEQLQVPDEPSVPRWRETLSALLANRLAAAGLVVLALLILAAVFADLVAPYSFTDDEIARRLEPPSRDHWFGTDELGRDVLSRVIFGARVSLQVGAVAVGISLVLGTLIGLISGYRGGWVDAVLMRTMDVLFSFPVVLLAIAIVAVLTPSLVNTMIAIGVVFTPIFARVVRGSVLSVREEVYVEAARALGGKDVRILSKHVLANSWAPIIVQATVSMGITILVAAGLGFLGLGVQSPTPEWGTMLGDGRQYIYSHPHMTTYPGLAIFLAVLAFNLLGDGLRDALDPRLRTVEARQ